MSTIRVRLTSGREHTAYIEVDQISGVVVGGADSEHHIQSVNLEEWARVYPGVALDKAENLNIKDFAYVRGGGKFYPPD